MIAYILYLRMRFEIIISYLDYHIIERVIELRAKSKPYVGQVALAHKIGVSEGYMGKIENPKDHAKYNIRMLGRVAIALGLKSYRDLFPDKVYENDLVRVVYEESKSYSSKHKLDKNGKILRRYSPISITPLNEDEIEQWKEGELKYMTVIEK
ncbi:hypothetical protein Q4Q34_07260 [Flavivirga abyssicola]|uniref:hypothetical protein n=1 Tax=Flavivirga abyssicola TaxID=3063533 RepID=UPI0026DF618D|nr:hypothetical protein [Flavivirga sp. MEBiC07777]WVK14825.1 hypothetical protein Q4Q34_07260 [Flavivirga sp. MEBiC07777]